MAFEPNQQPAFSIPGFVGLNDNISYPEAGLTKIEYATIHIAAGVVSARTLASPVDIASHAHRIALEVLKLTRY